MRRVGILLADLFDEREFLYPYYRIAEAGYTPVVIGLEAKEYRAKSGFAWKAEAAAEEAPPLEGLLIPGASPPTTCGGASRSSPWCGRWRGRENL